MTRSSISILFHSILGMIAGLGISISSCTPEQSPSQTLIPRVDGEWWQIAGNPDLDTLTSPEQQPVDFGIWQAADGTWQVWSCIRKTREVGKTRLFHRWEGKQLTDTMWRPMGIAMRADSKLGEEPGGMQAPYVILHEGKYLMFYGDWNRICLAESDKGKTFSRVLRDGSPALFGDTTETNTRDAMVIKVADKWHCYYTAHPNRIGAVYMRTSKDLVSWSESKKVAFGGQAGNDKFWYAECPFVVQHPNRMYYHFRTQAYGHGLANKGNNVPQTSIYRSPDPTYFGIENDQYFVGRMEVAAPEIFEYGGQWYIAALMPDLDGIRLARLKWVEEK